MKDELDDHIEKLKASEGSVICPYCEGCIEDGQDWLVDENDIMHHEVCLKQKLDLDHTEDLVERRNNGHNTLDSALRFQNGGPEPW